MRSPIFEGRRTMILCGTVAHYRPRARTVPKRDLVCMVFPLFQFYSFLHLADFIRVHCISCHKYFILTANRFSRCSLTSLVPFAKRVDITTTLFKLLILAFRNAYNFLSQDVG